MQATVHLRKELIDPTCDQLSAKLDLLQQNAILARLAPAWLSKEMRIENRLIFFGLLAAIGLSAASSARGAAALSPAANRAFAPVTSSARALPNDRGDFDVAVSDVIARAPSSACECRSFSNGPRRASACLERQEKSACESAAELTCFWACSIER